MFGRQPATIWPVADYGPSERRAGRKIRLLGLTWVLAVLAAFYRRRLSGAFAARRVEHPGGQVAADGYDFGEPTGLSAYGKRSSDAHDTSDFPEVIFAAAANMTGEHCAPLGAASFTLSSEWIGGPDIGYFRTRDLEDHVSRQLKADLTVEAAMAISGAAFASAMGRMGRWYGTLLTVTGARLGSWLRNLSSPTT